jgi:hypothetical protein
VGFYLRFDKEKKEEKELEVRIRIVAGHPE